MSFSFSSVLCSAYLTNLKRIHRLSDIAALLDLDLDSEVYPMARMLVYNRKAKIIDVVPPSLKNIYAPPSSLPGS